MRIALPHVHTTKLGYGRLGVKLAAALEDIGVEVYDQPSGEITAPYQRDDTLRRAPRRCGNVCWVSLPGHAYGWWDGQVPSIFTMWEATNLPPGMTEGLHNFHQIIVPSTQNLELFSRYHGNVHRVALGVGPEWKWRPRPAPDRYFRFLTSGIGARKNPEGVAKAFKTVFPHAEHMDPQPRLVVKTPSGVDSLYGAPSIEQVTGKLTDAEELDLYASCHAYVTMSRGEGFGLQPLQAMIQGMPTVLGNAHGHAEFANFATHPVCTELVDAAYFLFGDAGQWWEPDFEETCEAFYDIYQNYDLHVTNARNTSKMLYARFNWTRTARDFISLFHDGPDVSDDASWHKVDQRLYFVRVMPPGHRAELPDGTHMWEPDQTYYETADVKRLLFEGGYLHPDALTGDDLGLSPGELARVDHMRARNAHCPTCGQELNTRPTLADKYYEGSIA